MPEFEAVIGLETHIQLNSVTKIFCSCSADSGQPPNTNICRCAPACRAFFNCSTDRWWRKLSCSLRRCMRRSTPNLSSTT